MARSYRQHGAQDWDGSRNRKRWPAYKAYREHAKRAHNRSALNVANPTDRFDDFTETQWDLYGFGYGFRDRDKGSRYYHPKGRYPTRQDWLDLEDDNLDPSDIDEVIAGLLPDRSYHPDQPDWRYYMLLSK